MPTSHLEIPKHPDLERDHRGIFPGMGILTELQTLLAWSSIVSIGRIQFLDIISFGQRIAVEFNSEYNEASKIHVFQVELKDAESEKVLCRIKDAEVIRKFLPSAKGHEYKQGFQKHPLLTVHGPSIAAIDTQKHFITARQAYGYQHMRPMSLLVVLDGLAQAAYINAREHFTDKVRAEEFFLTKVEKLFIKAIPLYGMQYTVVMSANHRHLEGKMYLTRADVVLQDCFQRDCISLSLAGMVPDQAQSQEAS